MNLLKIVIQHLKGERMQFRFRLVAVAILAFSSIHLSLISDKTDSTASERPDEITAFAVVELFTSEGCSSCPRADKLVSGLYASYHSKNMPVYVLAFHVDYWDGYGWTDAFGKSEFSERQRRYGSFFKLESIYTPQLIINGCEEMVGSNPKAGTAIESVLQKPASVIVTLGPVADPVKKKINLHYTLSDVPGNAVLNCAVVESGLVREIWQGENKGRTLKHDNVVRYFRTFEKPLKEGNVEIDLPSDLHVENSSIVAFIQDEKTWHILGAGGISLK